MDQVLEVKNLTKDYGTFHLNQVSFQLPPGSIMGFIGENGAGKTTTIKLILDTINRDSGEITIFGEPLNRNNNSIKEHIGVVLDESSFPENVHANDINRIMKNC